MPAVSDSEEAAVRSAPVLSYVAQIISVFPAAAKARLAVAAGVPAKLPP
jgi:hypothetical protein